MSITKKYTNLGGKNNLVLEESEIWFDNNLWTIIKEYAGIYNFAINWKFKMSAHYYWVHQYVNCFRGWTQVQYKKTDEAILRREFWKDLNAGMYIKRFSTRHPILPVSVKKECLECFENRFNDFSPPADLLIGDIVRCASSYSDGTKIGRVIKKTAKTFSVALFSIVECDTILEGDYILTRFYRINTNITGDVVIIKTNYYSRYEIETKINKKGTQYNLSRDIYLMD